MSESPRPPASVNPDVLSYYQRNWKQLVDAYGLDPQGYPVDPAWYRRRLYNDFLDRVQPETVLDVGCGAGQTVVDVLARGRQGFGIEPVPELVEAARSLLRENGHDPAHVRQGDLSTLANSGETYDCLSLLSVLTAVPFGDWEAAHTNIAASLKPGGWFFAAYRNQLFDLYTFNSFTVEFYDRVLWEPEACRPVRDDGATEELKSLVTHPDLPGPFHTNSPDKMFGRLERPKSNPLTLPAYLAGFGLDVERTRFYNFHCVPPLLNDRVADIKKVNHQMELTMSDDWRGNVMAAMVVVEARKRG